eukprot:GFYU01006660.1.p2 GENE.GFYU01006660.1~~GFYU01006660.1.p2  ORF type:complete len:214 (-),score=44.82 GFYU01006660.1:161-802(-)
MKVACVVLVFAAFALVSASADDCLLSESAPAKPVKLRFCKQYKENACCMPAHDDENRERFEALVDVGKGCHRYVYHELRQLYCIGCSPDQPKWTETFDNTTYVNVCKSFANKLFNPITKYDACGLKQYGPCPSVGGDDVGEPFQCGDDLVIPSHMDDITSAAQFLNQYWIMPPGFEDFTFAVVPDSAPCFNSAGSLSAGVITMLVGTMIALLF